MVGLSMKPLLPVFLLCAALVAAAALTGCGGGTMDAKEAAGKKILLVGNGADPRFMDLHLINSVSEHHIMLALFEGLVAEHKSKDDDVEPGVAERWETNSDKSVWTFHLRQDARWSDGVPITAEDFVWSWRRMLTAELAAEYSQMLFALKHGRGFSEKKLPAGEIGVKAKGCRSVPRNWTGDPEAAADVVAARLRRHAVTSDAAVKLLEHRLD